MIASAGALSAIPLQFVGTVFAGEILMVPIAFLGLMSTHAIPPQRRIDVAFISLLIVAFLATDLITGNSQENLLRGVARSGFLLSNFLALNVLCGNSPPRLALFLFSYAICDLFRGLFQPQFQTLEDFWKFQAGISCTLIALSFLDSFNHGRIAVSRCLLAAITMVHLLLNYRSAALVSFVMLLISYLRPAGSMRLKSALHRAVALLAIVLLLAVFYDLYDTATERFVQRNRGSNAARVAGIVVAIEMISESPLIGYGSWVYSAEVVNRVSQRFTSMTGMAYYSSRESMYASAHSQFLQAWYEAGIFATPFFLLYFLRHAKSVFLWVRRPEPAFRNALVFLLLLNLWHFLLSPFSGPQRITMALGLATALTYIENFSPITSPSVVLMNFPTQRNRSRENSDCP
ncbi:MAG: hypothetical protein C0504_00120 [Candidatus Solibacter sp.]|nr:hypothetical protein [Candidatus Solibacter sp.]